MQTRAESVVGVAEGYSQDNFNEAWSLQINWDLWFNMYLSLSSVSRAVICNFENHIQNMEEKNSILREFYTDLLTNVLLEKFWAADLQQQAEWKKHFFLFPPKYHVWEIRVRGK